MTRALSMSVLSRKVSKLSAQLRYKANCTQTVWADKLGIGQNQYNRLERGVSQWTWSNLERLLQLSDAGCISELLRAAEALQPVERAGREHCPRVNSDKRWGSRRGYAS